MIRTRCNVQVMRGVGCTVNDMWDHKLDAKVERSRYRPIAAGVLTLDQAMVFLAAQCGLGGLFLLQLNPFTQLLGVSSFALAVTYPLMKRITNWVRPTACSLRALVKIAGTMCGSTFDACTNQSHVSCPLVRRTVDLELLTFQPASFAAAAALPRLDLQLGRPPWLGRGARLTGRHCHRAALPVWHLLDNHVRYDLRAHGQER